MDRRVFLRTAASLSVVGLAGCQDRGGNKTESPADGQTENTPTETDTGGTDETTDGPETESPTPQEPDPSIRSITIDDDTVKQTRSFTVSATVANNGDADFSGSVSFEIGDEQIATESGTVPADEERVITAETSVLVVGDHRVRAVVEDDDTEYDVEEVAFQAKQYPEEFVTVDGAQFTVGDGSLFFSGGAPNPYIYGFGHPDPHNRRDIMTTELERIGSSVVRLRPFAYNSDADPLPWRDNTAFFDRYDRILADLKQRNMRAVIPIITGADMYNRDPAEYPSTGVSTFAHHVDSADGIDDFFVNEECIELYKQWVDELLTHENRLTGLEYCEDPTIMMWELGNEVEWEDAWKRDSPALTPWIEEVGPYVQDTMGDEQLLSTGIHGWPDDRNDFVADHEPDSIDVCSLHWWAGPTHYDLPVDEAFQLVREKIDVAHNELGKPLWIGEYNWGVTDPEAGPPFTDRAEKLNRLHTLVEENDVAATAIHSVNNWELAHGVDGRERDTVSVYGDVDTEAVAELRRHAQAMRDKSTSSSVPPMPTAED